MNQNQLTVTALAGKNSSIGNFRNLKFNRNQLQSIIAFHIVKIIENGVGMLHYLNAFSTPFHNLLAYCDDYKKVESNNKIKKNILNIMIGLLGPFTFLIFILFIINHNFNRLLNPYSLRVKLQIMMMEQLD